MYKKVVLAIGSIAIIVSLMMPAHIEKPRLSIFDAVRDKKVDSNVTTEIDHYKTGVRTFSIALGTLALFYIMPSSKKKEVSTDV